MTAATGPVPLEVGEYAPPFELRAADGESHGMSGCLGRSMVVLFYPSLDLPGGMDEVRALRQRAGELDALGMKLIILSRQPVAEEEGEPPATRILPDVSGKIFAAYGLAGEIGERIAFLLDPSLRVVSRRQGAPDPALAEEIIDDYRRHLAPEAPRNVFMHAPVLIVPNVLPPALCSRLIAVWETQGNVDSGSMVTRDGKTVPVYNYDHKIRRDHFMSSGPDEEAVKTYIGRRVLPEVRRAFNYTVTRREDFRIACYDSARGGYFRPHRDNTTEGTAHRRFAMSLLLNDDYEGGYLRFPEYGSDLYRPRAGGAVVFSCSLLHEATDVTAGRRFVLLSFFYGDAEARVREAYNRKTGGAYRA